VAGFATPVLATLALGAVLWVTLDQMPILLGVDPTSPLRWQLPSIFAVAAVLGLVWALQPYVQVEPLLVAEMWSTRPTTGADSATPSGISAYALTLIRPTWNGGGRRRARRRRRTGRLSA
jgi:hypothetical protein